MTRWISTSRVSLLAIAVSVGVVADGCTDCAEIPMTLHFEPAGPGTAAAHVHGSSRGNSYVGARWDGTVTNRGAVPCRMAMYEHASEPDAAAAPVLERNEAARATTADGGVLVFESLLPAAHAGTVLVRGLDDDPLGKSYDQGSYLEPREDEDLNRIDVWLTIATCADPHIDVDLEVIREVCPRRARGSVAAEIWWPAS